MSGSLAEKLTPPFASLLASRSVLRGVLVLVIALCAFGNLPWTLDEYDQAKQAYVSYEILNGGDWLYQHTPRGDTATKPPLAGWISVGVKTLTGSWELAWRLPGFLCTLVLIVILMREGREILPEGGALLAAAAFGLNLLTPRISTLVRTDMMLSLFIFVCGWLVYRKIRSGLAWTTAERWIFCGAMSGALLAKGPMIYAFLLPGLVAFLLLAPKDRRRLAWCGWWPWLVPLGLFIAWGVHGLLTNQEFYDDVVVREFFSRFDQSLKSDERRQPLWFYFPHFLHKFLPWSLLLLALPVLSANVRKSLRERPEILWLLCWALGGLICMTFVPSKRVDRIYPIVPPFCLLLVSWVAMCQCGQKVRAWVGASLVFGLLFSGCYFAGIVWIGYHDQTQRLVTLGRTVREMTAGKTLVVVDGRDEGMILYTDGGKFLKPRLAREAWQQGRAEALLVPLRVLKDFPDLPPPALDSGPTKSREERYFLFLRNAPH